MNTGVFTENWNFLKQRDTWKTPVLGR